MVDKKGTITDKGLELSTKVMQSTQKGVVESKLVHSVVDKAGDDGVISAVFNKYKGADLNASKIV